MKENSKKKRNVLIVSCIVAGICLAGVAVAAVFMMKKNPLAEGLVNLSKEVTALEAELGEHFWTDMINQVGSENAQVEYSVNIGGVSALQNITVGLDGKIRRDMKRQLFDEEVDISVANAQIAELSIFGTVDALYLQVPSIWDGSIVFDTENVSGQWNASAARSQLQLFTGMELGIDRRIDAKLFRSFSVDAFSAADFLKNHQEELKALYENMEVIKARKAQKEGILSEEQAENLENYVLKDAEGGQIETTCYIVILPEKELKEFFADLEGDIRLCVYLDAEKRIVRICTLPEETLVTESGRGQIAINLTGREVVVDRIEIEGSGVINRNKIFIPLSGEADIEGSLIIEKNREAKGSYKVECRGSLSDQKNAWEFSLTGNVQGERTDAGEKLSLEAESFVLRSQNGVICRGSGEVKFAPFAEIIQMPSGKEYRVGEMNEFETMLFLAECTKNVYSNYSGYLKMLQLW